MEMSGIGLFGADEHLLGGRMIALLQQHVIDMLALRREPQPARGQPLVQIAVQFFLDRIHVSGNNKHEPEACQDLE